jgi:hypothetical protein
VVVSAIQPLDQFSDRPLLIAGKRKIGDQVEAVV